MIKIEKFWKVVSGILLSLFVLAACSATAPQKNSDSERLMLSAVTVTDPNFLLRPGDSLRWRRDILWAQGDNVPEGVQKLDRTYLRGLFERQLIQKGYRFTVDSQNPDYEIIAAVILGDSEAGDVLASHAKLYPELGESTKSLEKGTLMLGIARPDSKTLVWRSAIQTFINEDTSLSERQKRLQRVVASLLKELP